MHDNVNWRKATKKIGLARIEAWWGLKNLTYNFL